MILFDSSSFYWSWATTSAALALVSASSDSLLSCGFPKALWSQQNSHKGDNRGGQVTTEEDIKMAMGVGHGGGAVL